MRYVGMDIHSKTTTFCVIDDEGKICKRGKVESGESQWLGIVSHWPGEEVGVALESGNKTWWVVDVLRGAGIEPVVVDARQFKLISHSKKKSDKHDARALADALRGGLAQRYSVHVPREIARRGRSLLIQPRFSGHPVKRVNCLTEVNHDSAEESEAGNQKALLV